MGSAHRSEALVIMTAHRTKQLIEHLGEAGFADFRARELTHALGIGKMMQQDSGDTVATAFKI